MTQWKLVTCSAWLAVLLVCLETTSILGAVETPFVEGPGGSVPQLMLRPQRPSQFRHEGEVKAYLQRLRNWVEDSMRNNARFGKRSFPPISRNMETDYHKSPDNRQQWNDYEYYARNNI